MKKLLAILLAIVLLGAPAIALASVVTGATFYGIIRVSNNSTATQDVSCNVSINSQALIDADFLNSTCNNSAVHNTSGQDVAFMPGLSTIGNPWAFEVNSIGQDSFLDYLLYTGGPAMGGKIRYFPAAGGMTTVDNNVSLELGDNWTISQAGFINTDNGTAKNLVNKPDAFMTFVSPTVSENITSWIEGDVSIRVAANNDDAHKGWSGGAWVWDLNNAAQYVGEQAAGTDRLGGGMRFQNITIPRGATITSASVNFTSLTNQNGVVVNSEFSGETADNAVAFSTLVNFDARGRTAAVVAWDGIPVWAQDVEYTSPDLADVIQEITDRAGWRYGNALSIFWDDMADRSDVNAFRAAYTHDNTPAKAPIISIEYHCAPVTATGVDSDEHIVTTEAAPLIWAPGDRAYFAVTTQAYVVDLYNAAPKLWHSFWFRLENGHSPGSGNNWIFYKKLDATHLIEMYFRNDTGELKFRLNNGGAGFNIDTNVNTWAADTWYHAIASTSNPAGVRLRINNGAAITDVDVTALPDGGVFRMGMDATGNGITGNIANWICGTDDLTPAEETALYYGTAPGDEDNLWYFDEGAGANIISYGASANTSIVAGVGAAWQHDTRPCKLGISIDTIPIDGFARPVSVPNTDNAWVNLTNYCMPYMQYHRIWIDGVLRQSIEWEYAAIFDDLTAFNNDATPTFRTTCSDPDVSAVLVSFSPIAEADAPAYVLGLAPDFLTDNITTTGTFTITPTPTFPGKDVIDAVAAASGTPSQLPYTLIVGFVILALSVLTSWFLAQHGERNLWIKLLVIGVIMAFCIAVKVMDFWMLIMWLPIAIAIVLFSRRPTRA